MRRNRSRPLSSRPQKRKTERLIKPNDSDNKNSKIKQSSRTNQVRIIGGRFKRQSVPFIDAQGLRPTPDRLRETLFNWLQFDLHGANVLDLCAGSGVLGLESLSRGAAHSTFIDKQSTQAALIEDTIAKFKLSSDSATVYAGDALQVIPTLAQRTVAEEHTSNLSSQLGYQLVFVDPPYDLNLWTPLIEQLVSYQLVDATTLLYIEDRRPLVETLDTFSYAYVELNSKKMGQVYASLIQLQL